MHLNVDESRSWESEVARIKLDRSEELVGKPQHSRGVENLPTNYSPSDPTCAYNKWLTQSRLLVSRLSKQLATKAPATNEVK
jgi:hypothetical protein